MLLSPIKSATNAPVDVVLRPEDVKLEALNAEYPCGEVVSSIFKGVHYEMRVDCHGEIILAQSTINCPPGTRVSLRVAPQDIQVMHKSENSPDAPKKESKNHKNVEAES